MELFELAFKKVHRQVDSIFGFNSIIDGAKFNFKTDQPPQRVYTVSLFAEHLFSHHWGKLELCS